MSTPVLSAPTRLVLRLVSLAGLLLIAANFIGQWWFWEHRLPAWGFPIDRDQLLVGRFSLIWAVAVLVAAGALFDYLGTLPRIRRRTIVCALIAGALGVLPYLLQFIQSRLH